MQKSQQNVFLKSFFKLLYQIKQNIKQMQKWILIISLSILSSFLLTSIITSKIFIIETANYFGIQIQNIDMLYNMFNIVFIVFGLMILPWLTKYFITFVQVGLFLTVFTSLGIYIVGDFYFGYVALVPLQAMAYVLMMAAPFGVINLFNKNLKTYVVSILLFLPPFISNICILYGKTHIYYSYPIRDTAKICKQINNLNFFILLISIKCTLAAIYTLKSSLYQEIKALNKKKYKELKGLGIIDNYIVRIRRQFSQFDQELFICVGCWGVIIGVSLAFGNQQMVEVFFGQAKTQKSPEFYTQTELISNIVAFLLTNLLTSLAFKFNYEGFSIKLTNYSLLFFLNIFGLMASTFLQASISLPFGFFHHKFIIILGLVIAKIGLYYSAVFALAELSYYGSMALVGFGLVFVGNIVQIYLLQMLQRLNDSKIFIYITSAIWTCIWLVQKFRGTKSYHYGFKNLISYQKKQKQQQFQQFQQDKFIEEI